MAWQLLPTISAPMPFQMALDEVLFDAQRNDLAPPILRFYLSSGPWISAGFSFREPKSLSKSGLVMNHPHVPVCRRITGGGCVLHGKDLIFSLIAPYGFAGNPRRHRVSSWGSQDHSRCRLGSYLGAVNTSYSKIHEAVRLGLQSCGFAARFYDREDLPKGSDCFDFPVESDLSWKGRKIAGGSQKRSDGVLLHQESVSVPQGVKWDRLLQGVRQGFEVVFEARIEDSIWQPEVLFQAEKLATGLRPQTAGRRLQTAGC